MSTQLWTIVGILIGAVSAGGMTLAQALLQQKWKAADQAENWSHERRVRLEDKRHEAHLAFLDSYHGLQGFIDGIPTRLSLREDARAIMREFLEQLSTINRPLAAVRAYASLEAGTAATIAVSGLAPWALELTKGTIDGEARSHAAGTLQTYMKALRSDLGVDSDEPDVEWVVRSETRNELDRWSDEWRARQFPTVGADFPVDQDH